MIWFLLIFGIYALLGLCNIPLLFWYSYNYENEKVITLDMIGLILFASVLWPLFLCFMVADILKKKKHVVICDLEKLFSKEKKDE